MSEQAQLRWRCRRGMRELDALLQAFLTDTYPTLPAADKARFAALLELPDPDLSAYLLGRDVPSDPDVERLVASVRSALHP